MAQRSRVPQFGNWANGEQTSYTVYFDKARKGPNGPKIINPNDPQENPNINTASARAVRTKNEQKTRPEDGDAKQYPSANLPPRNGNMAGRSSNTRNQQPGVRGANYRDPPPRRPARRNAGSEPIFEKSPPRNRSGSGSESPSMDGRYSYEKTPGRSPGHNRSRSGSASPPMDGKRSHDKIHGSHGRSRQRPTFNNQPDRGPTVPKFGAWDEKNPASADGYTSIFNQVREEKKNATPQRVSVESTYNNEASKPDRHNSHQGCFPMFPWCKSF